MFIRNLLSDLRYGLRTFRGNLGFNLALVLILGLGIGGTTSIFTVIYGVIVHPLPFKNPGRLVMIGAPAPPEGDSLAWWSQAQSLSSLCEYRSGGVNLTEGDWPARTAAAAVSASFFSVFEIQPNQGRPFVDEDEIPGRNRLAILSHRLWIQNFGGDSAIIGKDLTLNGVRHTVVGVMPEGFSYPARTEIWLPRTTGNTSLELGDIQQADSPASLNNSMIGRLRPDVVLAQARSDLLSLFARLKETNSQSNINFGSGVQVVPLQDVLTGNLRPALFALFAGVGFLLLVACANAASLVMARAVTRQKEIAVRLSLGARPARVMQQLLTESVFAALVSGIVGVMISLLGVKLIKAIGPRDIPRLAEVHIDLAVLLFALSLSILVGMVVGLAPMLQVFKPSLTETLKEAGSRSSHGFRRRPRRILVIVQVAVALVLVMGAGVTMRSFFSLSSVPPGYDPNNVLTMSIALPKAKYWEEPLPSGSPVLQHKSVTGAPAISAPGASRFAVFNAKLFDEVANIPGVAAVGCVTALPLTGTSGKLWVDVPGSSGGLALFAYVNADYFGAMRIPVVRGRSFGHTDTESSPRVVIINEALARLLWGEEDPISQKMLVSAESVPREVVAIVRDTRQVGLSKEAEPQFYLPYSQPFRTGRPPLNMVLVVRTEEQPEIVINSLRTLIASSDPDLPIFRARTMREVVSESISAYRFRGTLMSCFALLACSIAAAGIYGLLSYSVTTRTHEIGVRISLGARRVDIVRLVVKEGMLLVALGTAIGIAASFGLNRFISSLLYGIQATDFTTLSWSVAVILTGALLACLVPAFAAARIEPAAALRYE